MCKEIIKKKIILAHDWTMEVSRALPSSLIEGKIPLQN